MGKEEYIKYRQKLVDEDRERGNSRALMWVLCVALVIALVTYISTEGFQKWPDSIFERLSFGVSTFAVLIAVLAFTYQRTALDIQAREAKQSIESMIESNDGTRALLYEISLKSERDQISFRYSSFDSVRSSLVVIDNDTKIFGKEVFKFLFLDYPYSYSYHTYKGLYGFLKGAGDGAYTKSESLSILSPYFNLLFEYLRYIDSCTFISQEEKANSVKILRASLTPFEVIMLYYHGLMPEHESDMLRKLLEKYSMLVDMDFEYLIADNNYRRYEPSAFGSKGEMYIRQREKERANWPCNRIK